MVTGRLAHSSSRKGQIDRIDAGHVAISLGVAGTSRRGSSSYRRGSRAVPVFQNRDCVGHYAQS